MEKNRQMEQLWNIDLQLNIHVIKWHRNFGTGEATRTDTLFFVVKDARIFLKISLIFKLASKYQTVYRVVSRFWGFVFFAVVECIRHWQLCFLDGKDPEMFVLKTQLKSIILECCLVFPFLEYFGELWLWLEGSRFQSVGLMLWDRLLIQSFHKHFLC